MRRELFQLVSELGRKGAEDKTAMSGREYLPDDGIFFQIL